MIERHRYIERLMRLKGPALVKVLTGMRRSGKSALLRDFARELSRSGVSQDHIVSIDLERVGDADMREGPALLSYVRERRCAEGVTYVLVDEAQQAAGIAGVAYTLLEEGGFDLYLTGSHSRLMTGELTDVLAGRVVEVAVLPLSFAEYASAHGQAGDVDTRSLFARYLRTGGLPYAFALEDDPYALSEYLDGVYHTVVRRDVAASLGKEDPTLLDAIVRVLATQVGHEVSASSVSKELALSGRPCSDDTCALYLKALTDAYCFLRMSRLDIKSGVELKTRERYFACDPGLLAIAARERETSVTAVLRNVVYLELRRRYRHVYAGKHYGRQVDFVCEDAGERTYFQVAPSVLDPRTLDQTLQPLRLIRDNFEKCVLTLDEVGPRSHEGIRQRHVVSWLMEGERAL